MCLVMYPRNSNLTKNNKAKIEITAEAIKNEVRMTIKSVKESAKNKL